MLKPIMSRDGKAAPHDPARRGYHAVYRQGYVNHCPGCGRTHWLIGRFSAECGFCAAALPLTETAMLGAGTHSRNWQPQPAWEMVA